MASDRDMTITRVLDAPIAEVWRAWTDPEVLQKWWGPRGVTNPTCVWEASSGGNINIVMLAGEQMGNLAGSEWPMTGTFQEVTPTEKLVYSSTAIIDGKPVIESTNTVILEDQGGKTKMTLHVAVTKATAEAEGPLAGMEMGWNQSIDKLAEILN
jgi:uncharacterized protein YndB with AHSA1/START domain